MELKNSALINVAKNFTGKIQTDNLELVQFPDPRLITPCQDIIEFDSDYLQQLKQKMFYIMQANNGIGLAAPQIGLSKRLFVVNIHGLSTNTTIFINPILYDFSKEEEILGEGCLSLPGVKVNVKRPKFCKIKAQDIHGRSFTFDFVKHKDSIYSRVCQHENDHLNGKLITDFLRRT